MPGLRYAPSAEHREDQRLFANGLHAVTIRRQGGPLNDGASGLTPILA